jgi:hypothetical protein
MLIVGASTGGASLASEAGGSSQAAGGGLGAKAELCGLEDVALGHRLLRAVQAIKDELAKKAVTDLAGNLQVVFAFFVDQIDVVAGCVAADVGE